MKRWLLIVSAALGVGAVIFIAALPALKRQGELTECKHQMRAILCVACGMWPEEHGDHLPSDFVSMSPQYISTPAILFCRADHSHPRVWNWALFNEKNCSYEIVSPGVSKSDTSHVFMRCKVHGLVGYVDGRLLDSSGKLVSW